MDGDLVLGDADSVPLWSEDSSLLLRNLSVGALQDHAQAWDNLDGRLDLVGFSYERLGGLRAVPGETMVDRPIEWLRGWIGKQRNFAEAYFPQPYQQLADTLRAHGFPDKADAIMISANDHRRDAPTTPWTRKALLWGGWATIGYGYESWRSLVWLAGLVAFGAWAAGRSRGLLSRATRGQRFWYSVDQLIPLIQLNEGHKKLKPTGWPRWYFYIHHILGFILASLFVAGLTGLAK